MALYAPIALLALPTVSMIVGVRRVRVHLRRPRGSRLAQRAHDERVVAAHAGFRTSARSAVGVRGVHGGRDRPRAPRLADRVPADDLQLVLAARGRGDRSRDPRRHAADAGQHARPRAPAPASCSSSTTFWELWMAWFTEVQETHTSYGSLVFFRSPNPHRSWVTAAGAVLDTAAIRLAVVDIPVDPRPRCASAPGISRCARSPASSASTTTTSPHPTTRSASPATSSTRCATHLVAAGRPGARADRDQAWRDFAGWRVNYDRVLITLAGFVMAPYAPWVSDRSPIQPLAHYGWGRRRVEIVAPRPDVALPKEIRGRRRARSRGRRVRRGG